MSNFLSDIRNNHSRIQRALLFIIAGAMLVLMLPKEGKFKYEYQKGKPWLHEDLVAPFDFAIEKPADKLNAEIDQVRENARIYLRSEGNGEQTALVNFDRELRNQLKPDSSKTRLLKKFDLYLSSGQSIIRSIYTKGVLRNASELDDISEHRQVFLLDGNVATEIVLKQVFTVQSAFAFIQTEVQNIRNIENDVLARLLSEALVQNIFYDEKTSQRDLEENLNSISEKRGMIPKGLMVINRGDMVDSESYVILESLRKEYGSRLGSSENYAIILLGQIIMISIVLLMFFLFLIRYRSDLAQNNWQITFLLMLIVLMVFIASSVLRIDNINLYVVPFCLMPVIVRSFFDSRIALFSHITALIIIGFEAPNGFEFMFLELIAGMAAIFSLMNLQNRSQLFVSMLIVFTTYSASYLSIAVMQEGDIRQIDLSMFAWFAGSVGLTLLAYPLIYLFEKTFGFISDVTLLELNNTNHKLLRQMASETPGTFQHSLQVASLAEAAVYEIGGNALLVRTGALYHDIGKLYAPMYFIENQVAGINPHDELSFEESVKIIIDHVIKGIEMAKENNLPEQLIDFIRTHHGTSTVQYFYRNYLQSFPEDELDKEHFSYPGPKPFTKEMAVLMMADGVEAASRSLKEYTTESVGKLVDGIIDHQFNEGQFDSAAITLSDIS
ncbi:MAG: HDIG domain-containing protein, partial [Flavobacteriales bacterium]|nr:HDIG domain-containing protein [Flavobacteriales bacterium]